MTSDSNAQINDLETLREYQEEVFKIYTKNLGSVPELINELHALYRELFESLKTLDFHGHLDDNLAFKACLMGCHYDMNQGLLTLFRGHTIETAFFIRRTIEYAAFGSLLLNTFIDEYADRDGNTPHKLSLLYLNSAKSNNAFENYRKEFRLNESVEASSPVFGQWLCKQYDALSKEVHASFLSVDLKIMADGPNHTLSYFQISGLPKIAKGIKRLHTLLKAHLVIVSGFHKLLLKVEGYKPGNLLAIQNSVSEMLTFEIACREDFFASEEVTGKPQKKVKPSKKKHQK